MSVDDLLSKRKWSVSQNGSDFGNVAIHARVHVLNGSAASWVEDR